MNRLVVMLVGTFLMLGTLFVLWYLSPAATALHRQLGVSMDTRPRDVALLLNVIFALGFILTSGHIIDRLTAGVSGALAGGTGAEREPGLQPVFLWGIAGYALLAALFGFFIVLLVEGSTAFGRFFDPVFLVQILRWPYQLMAAAQPFGLGADSFY